MADDVHTPFMLDNVRVDAGLTIREAEALIEFARLGFTVTHDGRRERPANRAIRKLDDELTRMRPHLRPQAGW